MTLPRGRGPERADIMLVGEAYGAREEAAGSPFVGPAGNVLNELLMKAGIRPGDCYFTNLVNARPPGNDLSAWFSRGIPNATVLEGWDSLSQEIASVNPNIIVPLGNWPLWALYNHKLNSKHQATGILNYRGYVLEARRLASSKKIMPTVHPSYILQGGYGDSPLAILDLQRANKESKFPDIRRKPRECIIDPQGAERVAIRDRLLREGRWLCVDIEYIGSRLLCVGFAVSSDWATTIRIRSPADLAWCAELITSGRPLLAQNAMFDLGILDWFYRINAFEHLAYDTMVAAYNLNIEFPKDLGFLGSFYTDVEAWWDVINWPDIREGRQSEDEIWKYNCYDNMVTYEAAEKQVLEMAEDPKIEEAFAFDMKKLPALWRMAKRGVRIDVETLQALKLRAEHDRTEGQLALNAIAEALGMNLHGMDLNVKSPDQMPEFLFAYAGVTPGGKTPGGSRKPKWKTDNVTLMECMRKTEDPQIRKILELIIRTREARDLKSKTLEIEWDDDGRARCIYDATKTTTRRLSSKVFFPTGKGSNLQNIPAPGSSAYGKDVRSTFVADPGMEFGYADLKGAEFLIVAEETQDPLMLKYAQMSIDGTGSVHKETAALIFSRIEGRHIDPSEISKDTPRYFLGKKTRHSGNYMVGWKELMGRINGEALETGVFIDAAMMKKILNIYTQELHPGLPLWWDEVALKLRQTGMLRNWFGFPRRFNGHFSQILPQAVAFGPQSTVGDCLNFGLLACDSDPELAESGFQLLLNVHDAIGFQYPVSNRELVLRRVNELMAIPLTVPKTGNILRIPVEIAVGPNWGDLEEWKHG